MKGSGEVSTKLEFGVPKGTEKSKLKQTAQAEYIVKMANVGKVFSDLMIGAKDEEQFAEACKELYRRFKAKDTEEEKNE